MCFTTDIDDPTQQPIRISQSAEAHGPRDSSQDDQADKGHQKKSALRWPESKIQELKEERRRLDGHATAEHRPSTHSVNAASNANAARPRRASDYPHLTGPMTFGAGSGY